MCGTPALGVGCMLAEQTTGKNRQSTTSPIWEVAIPPPIIMNFGLLGGRADYEFLL
jgi:hypothetical protein